MKHIYSTSVIYDHYLRSSKYFIIQATDPLILTTVYVFIGENWALLDFIDIMNDRNLLATGEYVVLAIDNSIDDVSDNQVRIFN